VAEGRLRRRRGLAVALAAVLLAAGGGGLWLHRQLRASLPQLEGERRLPGLSAPVRVERDGRGVPRIAGASRLDVSRALGFVHAQERFFQMDLLRRRAAGEVAEIVGPAALPLDRAARLHRFRAAAERVLAREPPAHRAMVAAYAEGVNAGLAALAAPPFEYLALRRAPAPWKPEDTVLVLLSMFVTLQSHIWSRESGRGLMHDVLPPGLVAFLAPDGTAEWDAPIVGGPLAGPAIPGPSVVDLRHAAPSRAARTVEPPDLDPDYALGSNNWAVSGAHTATGVPLLADDMHLQITVPNTWYHASLRWMEGAEERTVSGVTLPGAPAVSVGSNGRLAWGFTNSEGDWADLVLLDPVPGDADAYQTPQGPRKLERKTERIRVKGAADESLVVEETIWGPVLDKDHRGRRRALHWVAQEDGGVNLGLLRIETAASVAEAQALAGDVGIPAQNLVAADRDGHIGWTILGRMPRRVGFDGRLPGSWADGSRRWDGWLSSAEHPRVVDPASGRIWTANSRVVDGQMLRKVGFGGYDLGARARQIRDRLLAIPSATAADMLHLQLDDRALFLARWRDLLLQTLGSAPLREPRLAEMRMHVEKWGGRASVDSVGYRIVREFRTEVAAQALGALTEPCRAADARFRWNLIPFYEGPLWALVTARPAHLLDPRHATWHDQLMAAATAVGDALTRDGARLADQTWGRRNTAQIRHPLSRAVPALARYLDMPALPLPGDSHMPRAQTPENGASERMVVSPGREAEGILHMPGGQSGHPLSPHYADGHSAWVKGEPMPFLPGPAAHVLTLRP
jgi:penicillin G amidase